MAESKEEELNEPHQNEVSMAAPSDVIQLWIEVGNGLDKNQTVVWKSAVDSLGHALKYLRIEPRARVFIEKYMTLIIGILVEQQPSKIGVHERNCVQDSLMLAIRIVADDLAVQIENKGTSTLLTSLAHVFNKKKAFYKGSKGTNWSVNHHQMVGMPEVRVRAIERFRSEKGFVRLCEYLQMKRATKAPFPPLMWIHDILCAACDVIPSRENDDAAQEIEDDAIRISKIVMDYIGDCTEEELKKLPTEEIKMVQTDLQRIFDRLVVTRRKNTYEFYEFWRGLVLNLIRSQSLPLKLFGWEQVADLIRASEDHRPPPRGYVVSSAGTTFANGFYRFGGAVTPDGYAKQGTEFSYVREIPADETKGAGKKLTLFRCTMRSQQKWWFLSEADEEQPGTDRDIDYYQHKSKDHEDSFPPPNGWVTCRNSGTDPPPLLKAQGLVAPDGAEYETLEHQLAKWAIENEIVEQVLGDTTIHREVVSRSTVLIKFLASMCTRASGPGSKYCLQASHLLYAWKTCTRKADATVSLQVYQLLVSILPLCPSSLAIPLLRAVQASLNEGNEKRDFLFEVSEFCSALADGIVIDTKNASNTTLSDEVRDEALSLLWSVLTHPEASSLKSYDNLKQYVAHELKIESKGRQHRDRFLESCVTVLAKNEKMREGPVNEQQALRMVKLFDFVFAACPKPQAETIASKENGKLPSLIFREMTAYLDRKRFEKCKALGDFNHGEALKERLRILRHIYGLSVEFLSPDALTELWGRCTAPGDREAVMVFIADASLASKAAGSLNESQVSSAISEDACKTVFLDLFCSPSFQFDTLGESGYGSFQQLFNQHRVSLVSPSSKRLALDALWRICLTVDKDSVADAAMADLLQVYDSLRNSHGHSGNVGESSDDLMSIDGSDENFESRIYECLTKLRDDMAASPRSAKLSIQRCLRILKAAIGAIAQDPLATLLTVRRLARISATSDFESTVGSLPHGLRGQACYRRIGVIFKGPSHRTPSTQKFPLDVHPLESLISLKNKVATACNCPVASVKSVQINGRGHGAGLRSQVGDSSHFSLGAASEDLTVDELGIVQGCEVVFVSAERPNPISTATPNQHTTRISVPHDLSSYFFESPNFAGRLHRLLLDVLGSLPKELGTGEIEKSSMPIQKLVWDLLFAMPTDEAVANNVRSMQASVSTENAAISDAMDIDDSADAWSELLDISSFDASVYVLMTIDSFLQPAPEALSLVPDVIRETYAAKMTNDARVFRRAFIDGGGFAAVVRFFSAAGGAKQSKTRRGNAVALRVLKTCLFGTERDSMIQSIDSGAKTADLAGLRLLQSLANVHGLLQSLTAMVVEDDGISSSTISDVLRFLALLFQSPRAAETFVSLSNSEKFLVVVLLWNGGADMAKTSSAISAEIQVRKTSHGLVLQVPVLADFALPCLIRAISSVSTSLDCTTEFFDILEKLIHNENSTAVSRTMSLEVLREVVMKVCDKLATCPKPVSESAAVEQSTGVLCGCLKLLRALIEEGGGNVCKDGTNVLLSTLGINDRWSSSMKNGVPDASMETSQAGQGSVFGDQVLVDLIGAVFDGFLSPSPSTGIAICCDKESRRRAYEVISAGARSCETEIGYNSLVFRLDQLIERTAPSLRHRWGQFGVGGEGQHRTRNSSLYTGLRNQGCTCYMNSVLQQLFMMPDIQNSMLSATLPSKLRSSKGGGRLADIDLVGRKISLQWDSGVSYDATVLHFDPMIGAHTIRYLPIQIAAVGGTNHSQVHLEEITRITPFLPEEFVLSEGRPGKETGVYEVVPENTGIDSNGMQTDTVADADIKESEDESTSRLLLEEVQRTFIHLKEGSKGRCFDPRSLVEACACLKLEFDVWQQNDASEFATKFLDRLEISLKKWAPTHFDYLEHTFGIKQTKQKICKECGLKTNREEKLLNIDCQIRGKSDIHEALAAMTEVEIMEGSNKVFCDSCKKNTDTVLRTAISTLPNILLLSLKRFDLDFTTFETVKLNSRCAFGQSLNLKPYTLEGIEAEEENAENGNGVDPSPMDTDETEGNQARKAHVLADEDYEYRLVGVLVHAGVAQGGHYYSFIKERTSEKEDKWYRFDDEDVTLFDPAQIETECFGGKVKKETKWPNGQVHTVEQEQFANALMLFYEKVKSNGGPGNTGSAADTIKENAMADTVKEKTMQDGMNGAQALKLEVSTGYDAYEPDVLTSNAAHRWQSFLFDGELQTFLKGLLGFCRLKLTEHKNTEVGRQAWISPMIQMLTKYVFDVLLYSSDLSSLNDWFTMLESILGADKPSGVAFTRTLARKTRQVSSNWLRTYLLECPERNIRTAALRVFSSAAILTTFEELGPLELWAEAWKEQMVEIERNSGKNPRAIPCKLEGKWKSHEDLAQIESGGASGLGIILSYLNELLDAMPVAWRFTTETCGFIRNLAKVKLEGRTVLHQHMLHSTISSRLAALLARERAPNAVRLAYPSASMSQEVANIQAKAETSPSANMVSMNTSAVMNSSDINSQRGPTSNDFVSIVEALLCIGGLSAVVQEPLLHNPDEMGRSRQRFLLSEKAIQVLTIIFQESCSSGVPLMNRHDLESFLSRIESNPRGPISPQKVHDIMTKYQSQSEETRSRGEPLLSIDGFLAHYRDCVQSNDVKLRHDLHLFGFRPDLSRRSRDARIMFHRGQETLREGYESVAIDVAELHGEKVFDVGRTVTVVLLTTPHIYSVINSVSEPLAEYLVAASVYGKDAEPLITRTLALVYQTPNDWTGSERVGTAVMVLQTISSTPGENQKDNIAKIMLNPIKAARTVNFGSGLLDVTKALEEMTRSTQYNNEVYLHLARYMGILREMYNLPPVYQWMTENRSAWAFIERDLLDQRVQGQQDANDFTAQELGPTIPLDQNVHSDSDMAGMNDSEDDDSQYENVEGNMAPVPNNGPFQVIVEGAGNPAVNGIYAQDGYFSNACRYTKPGRWNNTNYKFYIFQCPVSNNTRHWYISIVPYGGNPGTSSDIDFYTAPVKEECRQVPPKSGWVKSNEGKEPSPRIDFRTQSDEGAPRVDRFGPVVEDENEHAYV